MQKGGGFAAIFCAILLALQAVIALVLEQPDGLRDTANQIVMTGTAGSLFASDTLRIILGVFLLVMVVAVSARSGARARAKGQTNWVSVLGVLSAMLVCASGLISVLNLIAVLESQSTGTVQTSQGFFATLSQLTFAIALFLLTVWQFLLGLNSLLNRSFPSLVSLMGIGSVVLTVIAMLMPELQTIALIINMLWLIIMGLVMIATPEQIVPAAPRLLTAPRNDR